MAAASHSGWRLALDADLHGLSAGGALPMSIGAELRAARLARNLSLADIAEVTKINATILRAIENDAFDRVPRGVFTRAFLRAYAGQVGVDGEDLVMRYRNEYEHSVLPDAAGHSPDECPAEERLTYDRFDSINGRTGFSPARVLQFGVIIIVVGAYFLSLRQTRPAPPIAQVKAAPALAGSVPAAVPVGTTGSVADLPVPARDDRELHVELTPRGEC